MSLDFLCVVIFLLEIFFISIFFSSQKKISSLDFFHNKIFITQQILSQLLSSQNNLMTKKVHNKKIAIPN